MRPFIAQNLSLMVFSFDVVLSSPDNKIGYSLRWRHNESDGVSNHQPGDCFLNRLFRRRSEQTSKLRATSLCEGIRRWPVNSPYKGSVTRKMFPFDDVIMQYVFSEHTLLCFIWPWRWSHFERYAWIDKYHKSRNELVPYATMHDMHISVPDGALWDMRHVHCGICKSPRHDKAWTVCIIFFFFFWRGALLFEIGVLCNFYHVIEFERLDRW